MDTARPCDKSISTRFVLPSSATGEATLYVMAEKTAEGASPLVISVGDDECFFDTNSINLLSWLSAPVDTAALRGGENVFTVEAQEGWEIACESVSDVPVIRLRTGIEEAAEDKSIIPSYGDGAITAHKQEWLDLLPESLHALHDRWQWCWKLAGFLAAAWPYANEADACTSYSPWDARVILPWGRAGLDDNGEKPIAMCVHYGVSFVQFCIAMGVPARTVVLTPDLNSPYGHFIAEVWLEEFQSWAMIDPNLHLCYRDEVTAQPLSTAEVSRRRGDLRELAQFGEGFQSQKDRLESFAEDHCLTGSCYRFWGVWGRHDWIEHPEAAPPAHGAVPYAETDIIWCDEDKAATEALGMFPHFLSAEQLAAPPRKDGE